MVERKEQYYALSSATGATRSDSWVDIKGGIGTLFASRGRREFPNKTFRVKGSVEPLSKGGSFVGRHICVPLEGVAIHVNAFNFPEWGMLERMASTLLLVSSMRAVASHTPAKTVFTPTPIGATEVITER